MKQGTSCTARKRIQSKAQQLRRRSACRSSHRTCRKCNQPGTVPSTSPRWLLCPNRNSRHCRTARRRSCQGSRFQVDRSTAPSSMPDCRPLASRSTPERSASVCLILRDSTPRSSHTRSQREMLTPRRKSIPQNRGPHTRTTSSPRFRTCPQGNSSAAWTSSPRRTRSPPGKDHCNQTTPGHTANRKFRRGTAARRVNAARPIRRAAGDAYLRLTGTAGARQAVAPGVALAIAGAARQAAGGTVVPRSTRGAHADVGAACGVTVGARGAVRAAAGRPIRPCNTTQRHISSATSADHSGHDFACTPAGQHCDS